MIRTTKLNHRRWAIPAVLAAVAALAVAGDKYEFDANGGSSGDYGNGDNWQNNCPGACSAVPESDDDATILADKTCTVDGQNRTLTNLRLNNNSVLQLDYNVCVCEQLTVYEAGTTTNACVSGSAVLSAGVVRIYEKGSLVLDEGASTLRVRTPGSCTCN